MDKLIKLRDAFRALADITDEMIKFDEAGKTEENAKTEYEALYGRFLIKILEMNELTE